MLWPHPQPSSPAAVRVSFLSARIGVAAHPRWRTGRGREQFGLGKFGVGEVGRAQRRAQGRQRRKRGEREKRGKGRTRRRATSGLELVGTRRWERERGNGNGAGLPRAGFGVRRWGRGGHEGTSPRCPEEEAGRDGDDGGCHPLSLRPPVLKTAAESDFRSLGEAENQRNYKRNGTGRPGSRLDRSREGPRSPLRESGPPPCHPRGKRGGRVGRSGRTCRRRCAGGARVAIVSPPPARTRARAGKCRSCYSSFHSFPSQPPALDAAVGEVRPPGRSALTTPAVRVRVRAAGPVTTRWRAPPCLQPGNTTIFKPAPLTNRKC